MISTEMRAALERPWMRAYCRALALAYAYGVLVHLWHMTGLASGGWDAIPLVWLAADVVYALLDMAVVFGLWRRHGWGIVMFLLVAISQIVVYGVFAGLFEVSAAEAQGLRVMIVFHLVTLALFIWIWRSRI